MKDKTTSPRTLRLLMVEDSADDAELVSLELERAGFSLISERVETEDAFCDALDRQTWDLIVSDHSMPSFDGLRAFSLYKQRKLETPFIFVSGVLGEERAVEAMRIGARDYLLKGNLGRLRMAVQRELEAAERTRRQQAAEEAARREQRRFAMAVEASGVGVFEHRNPLDPATYVSDRLVELIGFAQAELPQRTDLALWVKNQIHADDWPIVVEAYEDLLLGRSSRFQAEFRVNNKQGHWVHVAVFAKAIERNERGVASQVVGVALDLTERKRLETEFRQAQKMEAVGRLAGGVAHDFNNLLTAVFTFGEFVLEKLPADTPTHADMQQVLKAAQKAKGLTQQLVAFSRKQSIAPRVFNLNESITELERMLSRLISIDTELKTALSRELGSVRIDQGAFEQVLMNLVINAQDAMPKGGTLTIQTYNANAEDGHGLSKEVRMPAGQYVVLSVSDTGVGMDAETQRHIFEPFFTTKEVGRGTGLGLSTCYGIVKQAGGFIWAQSELTKGTTFKIYLPRIAEPCEQRASSEEPESLSGKERILVVEDDESVRQIAVRVLRSLGYEVVEAKSGREALIICQEPNRSIDLLLTDVVMPEMSGPELAREFSRYRPQTRVLFMSGFTSHAATGRDLLEDKAPLLHKPFTRQALSQQVRMVLDQKPDGPNAQGRRPTNAPEATR